VPNCIAKLSEFARKELGSRKSTTFDTFSTVLPRLVNFKGGFLLPEDVLNAEIVFEDDKAARRSFTDPKVAAPKNPHRL